MGIIHVCMLDKHCLDRLTHIGRIRQAQNPIEENGPAVLHPDSFYPERIADQATRVVWCVMRNCRLRHVAQATDRAKTSSVISKFV